MMGLIVMAAFRFALLLKAINVFTDHVTFNIYYIPIDLVGKIVPSSVCGMIETVT